MAAVVHSAQYQQHRDGLLPAHVPVPELKIPVGKPAQGEQQFLTPRSLAAAERAVAEQEQLAAEAGSAAQRAFAEAEAAAATPRAASAAEAARIAAGKAAVTERSVAASSGIFELVVDSGHRPTLEVTIDGPTILRLVVVVWIILSEPGLCCVGDLDRILKWLL